MSGDMAHQVEPLDIDCINSEFDNKENTFNHNNALPCTEKGYEELDVSELNMKLRYSITPTASPMSKSFTNCTDNRNYDSDDTFNYTHNDSSLTRSLNSTMTKNENVIKSLKTLPLQSLPTDKKIEENNSAMRQSESLIISEHNNITVTINRTSDIDDNISLSSTTSSVLHTPEATTPTKELSKTDGGSPILRGLKSVLNMFRSSQSPITPADGSSIVDKHATLTPTESVPTKSLDNFESKPQAMASTPIATSKLKESNGSRRSSPYKDSIVFNEDLEKELQWKDETTIIFSHEKIPVHKLFFQQTKAMPKNEANQIPNIVENKTEENLNMAVETMDTSYNVCVMVDKTIPTMPEEIIKNESYVCNDSDSEFLDCETTLINNDTNTIDGVEKELKNYKDFDGIISTLDIKTDNKSNNFIQDHLDSEIDLVATTEPTELIDNVEYNNSPHIMIDSLDDNVNENILQVENTINVNENNINISKSNLENSICSECDVDSLEYNIINKTNNIDITNNSDDAITNRIQESSMHDIKTGNGLINSSHLPTEIPLTNEDNNKIEPNTIETSVILSEDSILHSINANTEIKNTLNETTELKIISNNFCNIILEDSIPSMKNEIDNDFLVKSEGHERNSYINIQEEISTNEGASNENIHSSVQNNNVVVTQALIDHKGPVYSELFDNLDTSKLCENKITLNYSMDQYEHSDSLCENFTRLEIHATGEFNNLGLPNDSQVIIKNMNTDIELLSVGQNEENIVNKEEYRKTLEGPQMINVNNQSDLVISNFHENKTESKLVHEEFLLQKPVQETITVLETKQNIENHLEDTIYNVESVGEYEIHDESKDIVSRESLPSKLNCSENMEKLNIILDANMKQLEEIDKEDCEGQKINYIETLGVSTECNKSLDISVGCEYLKSPNTLTENIAVEKNTNALINDSSSLEVVNNDNTVTAKQAIFASDELELHNKIQNENEYLESKHIKELPLNETIHSEMNLSTKHTEIYETLESNIAQNKNEYIESKQIKELPLNETINSELNLSTKHTEIYETLESNIALLKDVTENNASHTIREVLNEEHLKQEKTENINEGISSMKNEIIDTNVICNTKYLDKDANINELDTGKLDEEIVLSESNSPYVSVSESLDRFSLEPTNAQTEDANITITITNSPPITSKGYNFNFDEMDDPFAAKTNHRMSSTTKSMNQNVESTISSINLDQTQTPRKVLVNDRRKIQSEKKKQFRTQKKLNKTFSIDSPVSETLDNAKELDYGFSNKNNANTEKFINSTIESNIDGNLTLNNDKTSLVPNDSGKNKAANTLDFSNTKTMKSSIIIESSKVNKLSVGSSNIVSCTNNKNASSADHSSYYSGVVSTDESIKSRNVFNIPEIDDMNFNPFAVKSKLCKSPPPNLDEDNPFLTKSKLSISSETTMISHTYTKPQNTDSMDKLVDRDCEDKMDTEAMEKTSPINRSSDTGSSNASEKDVTVIKEINTEDEDTIEGPFIDDLNNDEIPCLDGENVDTMNFNDIPNQENEDNAEGELFIDAEAFQFLLNQNKSNVVADSGKESLFLKFDPLFAKRISSDSVITALSKIQNRQSTPMKIPKQEKTMSTTASSSTLTRYRDNINDMEINTDNFNVNISKPMMVVPPAVNAIATPRKSKTPTRTNRLSGTFTSPAMAVIDRLLSLSANNSLVEHEATFTQVSHEQNEANLALQQLRELLAEKEIHVCNLRSESKDLKDRLITLQSHMSALEEESQQRLKKIEELTETLSKRSNMDRNMAVVFEEYESTIANLIARIEKEKKQHAEERAALINERNEQTAHLTNMEVSFNDLHSKYEKIKQVIANYTSNEESYKKTLIMYEENFTKAQNNYELLKQHATSKLNYANEELQKINKAHEAEVLKMNAMIKRKDLHITSLEETLAQKTKANEELTAICDELINKVG